MQYTIYTQKLIITFITALVFTSVFLFFFEKTHAQESILYINDTENEIPPDQSIGLWGNYPTYTINDVFTVPLIGVSELRVPIAKFNPGANGCNYNKFTIYENGNEIYSTVDDFSIKYLYYGQTNYNYTNDTEQWSSFNIEPPLNFNTTSNYAFEFKSGAYYCYFSFVEAGNGSPLIRINGDPKFAYNALYALLGTSNSAPILDPVGNKSVNEGALLQFTLSATDPDGDNLTFSAANLPLGATFDTNTATFSWTPGFSDEGNYTDVEFTVTDDGSPMELDVELITITVGNVNRAPILTNPGPQEVLEDEILTFTVSATDPDGDAFVLSASNTPSGATFDPHTGTFNWTPDLSQEGIYTVTFLATDEGIPSEVGIIDVVITVGDNPTPVEQAEDLVDDVIDIDVPQNVENSYLANLQKVATFIEEGKIQAAINQLEAFISKVEQDFAQGILTQQERDDLIAAAENLIADIEG